MKKALILLSLIFLVYLSGCINQEKKGTTTGVIIKTFKPDISEIFSGDSVVFTLTIENVGEEDASNVQAKLFGLGTDWTWDSSKQTIGSLMKSDSQADIPGGTGDATWDATSPSGLKVDNSYTAGVRVYYSYKTTASGTIWVYNQNYLKANPTEAEEIMGSSGIASFSVTKAPVNISLSGVARPLIYRSGTQSSSLSILIDNEGQGYPYRETETDMEITVTKFKVANTDCLTTISDTTPRLPRSGQKSISCTFNLPSEVVEYTTIPVEVELSYNYYLDGSTTVKVLKSFTPEESTTTTTNPSTTTSTTSSRCPTGQKWCASLSRCIDESAICPA